MMVYLGLLALLAVLYVLTMVGTISRGIILSPTELCMALGVEFLLVGGILLAVLR